MLAIDTDIQQLFTSKDNTMQYNAVLITANVSLVLIVLVATCLCCKRKIHKNGDMMGLEGMVKQLPDEVVVVVNTVQPPHEAHPITITTNTNETNICNVSHTDSEKRISATAHRSLPDIPVAEALAATGGDNGSELYETVADKALLEAANQQSSSLCKMHHQLKKEASVSQHSSLSQADDVSSPYSRVKNSPHDYAKVLNAEHPYAQLNTPSTSQAANSSHDTLVNGNQNNNNNQNNSNNPNELNQETLNRVSLRHSDENLMEAENNRPVVDEIPAASAIAGMISASNDLPYMTPPITNQHFSGDSQDSSKGYTSISVREPLANILAQNAPQKQQQQHQRLLRAATTSSRNMNDSSHYATVSDDSDETYAAIEDPNLRVDNHLQGDIYTSGSETYAQIQPIPTTTPTNPTNNNPPLIGTVEIHSSSTTHALVPVTCGVSNLVGQSPEQGGASSSTAILQQQPSSQQQQQPQRTGNFTNLRNSNDFGAVSHSQQSMHSRQASSSSNNGILLCSIGSPKPEKRQANSPLPPTPKTTTNHHSVLGKDTIIPNTVPRNSMGGMMVVDGGVSTRSSHERNEANDFLEESPQRKQKNLSPSKDVEGMYAKVMKKSKFNRTGAPVSNSHNQSPIMLRKYESSGAASTSGISCPDERNCLDAGSSSNNTMILNLHSPISTDNQRGRLRSNSYGASKDHGYETIPAEATVRCANVTTETITSGNQYRKSDGYAHVLQKDWKPDTVPGTMNTIHPTSIVHHPTFDGLPRNNNNNKNNSKSHHNNNHNKHNNNNIEKHYETIDIPEEDNVDNRQHVRRLEEDEEEEAEHGYETLSNHQQHHSRLLGNNNNKCIQPNTSSNASKDYEPNYEMVKSSMESSNHSTGGGEGTSDDGYAKVLEKKPIPNSNLNLNLNLNLNPMDKKDTTNDTEDDGYSKVKGAEEDDEVEVKLSTTNNPGEEDDEDATMAGYSTIDDVVMVKKKDDVIIHHNYASILETKRDEIDSSLDTDSDHYARISETTTTTNSSTSHSNSITNTQCTNTSTQCIELTLSSSTKSMPDELLTTPPTVDFSMASPISLTGSSFLLMNTSSSVNSSANITTNSSSTTTTSSRQTTSSSSQYESLTGSETDPNYESVCYLTNNSMTTTENPYERLHTDFSDTQLNSSSNSTPQSSVERSVLSSLEENLSPEQKQQQHRPRSRQLLSNHHESNNVANSQQQQQQPPMKMLKLQKNALGDNNNTNNTNSNSADILLNDYFHV